MRHTLVILLGAAGRPPAPARGDDPALDLPIGDPSRREQEAPLVLDGITDTARGEVLTPRELTARLAGVRVLFVGESHTSMEFHRVQKRVIEELARSGRRVFIGLEMYPSTEQAWLDQWVDGLLTEEGFLKLSRWYKNWGYHWNYYRDIFVFARERGLRMFAVNAPREVVQAVRKKGFANLTEEEAAHIPSRIDVDSAEHKRLFRALFGEGDTMHSSRMTEEQWEGMFRAQCTWDATMGYHAVQALTKHGDADTIMVVLIGSGHVAYGLGAERQAALWFDGRMASLIPIPVADDQGQPRKVRASYANFLWGLPRETDPLYPTLGVSTPERKEGEYFKVLAVQKDSVGAAAGFKVGDEIVSLDGTPITDKETTNRLMSQKRWGDAAEFEVRRGGQTITLTAYFRRRLPEPPRVSGLAGGAER
jgi:uncharacterized iron-regulated protein